MSEELKNLEGKNWVATMMLCWALGGFGAHRFYTGKVWTGILYLFTGGLCGIGVIVDMIMILFNTYRDKNGLFLINDLPTIVIIVVFVLWLILCFVFDIAGLIFGLLTHLISAIF